MIMRRIRSFTRRDSRITNLQTRAFETLWPKYGLDFTKEPFDLPQIFSRKAQTFVEIGFGSGHSLLALAKAHPENNYIGIETFKPGIGALLHRIEEEGLNNLRIVYHDAVEVLAQAFADHSLDCLQIFFPDPWRKRRHHKRRLIQAEFLRLVCTKLKPQGLLHIATDWEHYAQQMMQVLSAEPDLENLAGLNVYAPRSDLRPEVTKFEGRGEQEGRPIWELQFARR